MRLGVLSDVHANRHALEAVLTDADARGLDGLGCLGDVVGYNAHPGECIHEFRKAGIVTVRGNHDEAVATGDVEGFTPPGATAALFHRGILQKPDLAWLGQLPLRHWIDGILLVHASPRDPLREYLFPNLSDRMLMEALQPAIEESARCVLVGHTHQPMRRQLKDITLWNPGSVGQPRDGDARACYLVLDTATLGGEWVRVSYPVEEAAAAVRSAKLPSLLADRLPLGR